MADNPNLDNLASEEDLEERMAATISCGGLDSQASRLIAHYLIGGNSVPTELGKDKPGSIDVLVSADASINTSEVAARLEELAVNSYKANGNNATRAGLVGSVRGSNINRGPALDPDVKHLIIESFGELDTDHRAAFKEVLDTRSYTFTTESVREEVEAPGANLFIGNPAYGNFDEFQAIGEQIPAEPGIISGVDVVVTALGKEPPTAEPLDGDLSKSVVREASDIEVAWTDRAQESYRAILAKLESRDSNGDEVIRVQPSRSIEAVRKLSESTAKYRLSDEVTRNDVHSAWDLYASAYADLGVNLQDQSGFDADLETGDSNNNSGGSSVIQTLVKSLEDDYGYEGVPVEVVYNEAFDYGLSKQEAKEAISDAKVEGKIYEPKSDHYLAA